MPRPPLRMTLRQRKLMQPPPERTPKPSKADDEDDKPSSDDKKTSQRPANETPSKTDSSSPSPTRSTKNTSPSSKPPPEPSSAPPSKSSKPPSSSTASASTSTPVPEPDSGSKVNVGAVAAGTVLGSAVLVGIFWISIAKWRDSRRRRSVSPDEEVKSGFWDPATHGQDPSSEDPAVTQFNQAEGVEGMEQQPHQLTPQRTPSFVASPYRRPESQVPQDVLPQNSDWAEMPSDQPPDFMPHEGGPDLDERPYPQDDTLPIGLQAGRPPPKPQKPYSDF